jgi:hypothetical protein
MKKIKYNIDLSRYNLVELEVFLEQGIITVDELDNEVKERGLTHTLVTPPESRL